MYLFFTGAWTLSVETYARQVCTMFITSLSHHIMSRYLYNNGTVLGDWNPVSLTILSARLNRSSRRVRRLGRCRHRCAAASFTHTWPHITQRLNLLYCIYSCISRPAYKPTPFPTAKNLVIITDPHINKNQERTCTLDLVLDNAWVSYNGWLCSSSSTSLCVVIQNNMLSPTHPHSPSDLIMVHAVCGTHKVSVTDW